MITTNKEKTIGEALESFIKLTTHRNVNTGRSYASGLKYFRQGLALAEIDAETAPLSVLKEEHILPLVDHDFFRDRDGEPLLSHLSANSQRVYTSAVVAFMDYLNEEEAAAINISTLRRMIRGRLTPREETNPMVSSKQIERVIKHVQALDAAEAKTPRLRLINLRDRAFILTLSDTGFRVSEACSLAIKDIDFYKRMASAILALYKHCCHEVS